MPTQRAMEIFQSTPSVWRETPYIWLTRLQLRNFNPLPPYGGRLHNQLQSTATTRFQSTPSVWRETRTQRQRHGERGISIHSLRMEGDIFRNKNRTRTAYFNPLPPYGGRQHYAALVLVSADISIHSLRMEGDTNIWDIKACTGISIHSLRMEGDNCSHRVTLQNVHFNPLPPYGGRPERRCLAMKRFKFQSTPSVWRETFCSSAFRDTLSFQSTPSVWRETDTIIPIYLDGSISIHSLRMEGD